MIKEIYKYVFSKSATLLNREQLRSISSIKEDLTESEIKDSNARIASNYKILERIIAEHIKEQKDFMVNRCENGQQLLFSRGTINGISLIGEAFEFAKGQHEETIKPNEEFNKTKIF